MTTKHVEDVSMCALSLMQAAKKADREFCCYQSGQHTVRDANEDITKMAVHLLQAKAASEQEQRRSPGFIDPTNDGLDTLCNTDWVKTTLAKNPSWDELQREQRDTEREDTDFNYELSDIC